MAQSQIFERIPPRPHAWPPDRRSVRRLFWPGTAVIRIQPYGPDVLGVLLDLSEGGCGVEFGIGIPAQVGAQVEVDLNVRGVTLRRAGVIRYIEVIRRVERETRAGIEFIEASALQSEKVDCSVSGLLRHLEVKR
jgi:c-di-GMP-binding flagellar brake protein YcgR